MTPFPRLQDVALRAGVDVLSLSGGVLAGITGGLNMVQGDYDNDVDVFLLRGAWAEDKGRHPNSLVRNNGDGTLTDVTFDTGLGNVHYPTQTAFRSVPLDREILIVEGWEEAVYFDS